MDPQTTLTITGKTQDEQSGALDFGANDEKKTTMCLPCIKVAWPQYFINVFKNYLSVTEVSEKEALISLMLHQQERGRGKQVTAIHAKSKDTANSKIAQGIWQRSREFKQFFCPRLQMFICFPLIKLIWLSTC